MGGPLYANVISQLAGGWLDSLLFRTRTSDPGAIAGTAASLLAAVALACTAPALRAANVEPIDGLKEE